MTGWPHGRSRDGGVDEIPLPVRPGRLWLCGKHAVGPDPEAVLTRVGATTVVCLNERHELEDRYPDYVAWLDRHRPSRASWWPVPDLHAPPLDRALALLDDLRTRLDRGEGLVMHCGAGIGRAGTIAAGLLVALGWDVERAVGHVAAHRPMAGPEAGEQRMLLDRLAARLATGDRAG